MCVALTATLGMAPAMKAQTASQNKPQMAEQLFSLDNEARATAGAGRVEWDPALAASAMRHCLRMAAEAQIEHRYAGEADLAERAADAGAHFSLIEESIAAGRYIATIHQGWMNSPGHRTNMLNPEVDRVGFAVVVRQGILFAVADYARAVPLLTPVQVELSLATLIRATGVSILRDAHDARAACALDHGQPRLSDPHLRPRFVMRWQGADLTRLPQQLAELLASKDYRAAAVGSCPASSEKGQFTAYRMAVLVY